MSNDRIQVLTAACCLGVVACVTGVEEQPRPPAGVAAAALISGESCDPRNAAGVASRTERALLDTIAFAEGTRDHGKDGYNVTFAYRYFDDCQVHPNQTICSGSLCSTAAGRYQFLYKTYQGLKLPNFWPEQQERGALALIARRGVELPPGAMSATQFANALDRLSYEWSSLPPGRYGQTRRTLQQIRDEYCQLAQCAIASEPEPTAALSRGHDAHGFYAIGWQGALYLYELQSSGQFTRRAQTSGWDTVTSMGAGADYDLDGEPDFITMDFEYGLEVQFGDGAGEFWYSPLALRAGALVVFGGGADYDHDALPDFVAVDDTGALLFARGDGTGRFDTKIIDDEGDAIEAIGGGADYDGDGHADFVALRFDGSTLLYHGDGSGGFNAKPLPLAGPRPRLLGGGADYNADGKPDLLVIAMDGTAYLYLGQTGAKFSKRALGSGWDDVSFID